MGNNSLWDKVYQKIDDGIKGLNEGIPIPFPRLRKHWPSILRGRYFIVGGATKSGKTSIVDDIFLYNTLEYSMVNPDIDLHITKFSLEIDGVSGCTKAISRLLFYEQGLEFSNEELLGQNDGPKLIDENLLNHLKTNNKDFTDYFDSHVEIIDRPLNVTEIIKILEHEKRRLFPDYKTNPEKYNKTYWIVIIDHIALVGSKEDIDRLSHYLMMIRNEVGAIPVVVQQLNFDASNEKEFKNLNRPTPTELSFGNSREILRDCDLVIALFDPCKFNIASWDGYNTVRMKGDFRNFEIIANRHGRSNITSSLYFIGKVGTFVELPIAKDMTPETYEYYEKRKFLENKR